VKLSAGLFGDPAAGVALDQAVEQHIRRRAQKLAGRGMQPAGVAGARARAADMVELVKEIARALERNDMTVAQALIREGASLYGHSSLAAAVQLQATQDRTAALEAARESYRPEADLGEGAGAYYADYGRHYNEADRQRRNLAQFDDVGELVDAWRAGNVSWNYDAWGPDPDDVGCLIPWDPEAGS
jgi:hypothetical protein